MRAAGVALASAAVVVVRAQTACNQSTLQAVVIGAADGSLSCGGALCDILTCDARGVVIGISIDASNSAAAAPAGGSIPDAILSLSSLKFVELRDVAVTGTLPAALGSLRNLTSLRSLNMRDTY